MILTTVILSALFFLYGAVLVAAPLGQTAPETSPDAKPAIDGVLDLFKTKHVVALGDYHGLAQEEAFYSALIRDPRFAEQVGNVVVEFGGAAAQGTIDRYVNGDDVPFAELRQVWTDTAGWLPGPTALGYVNFYANVRAENLKLPTDHRIKVWLGDPKIDWSKIKSFQDIVPYLMIRDDRIFRIISDEILKKHKKTLLIIGSGHLFGVVSALLLSTKIERAYPNSLAVVSPFLGYIEPECNAKFLARVKNWPVPAVAWPVNGTWLKSELELPGCSFISPDHVERIKKMVARWRKQASATSLPPGVRRHGRGRPLTAAERIADFSSMMSGVDSDAILYLGPPDTFTRSPIEDSIYLDSGYFKEEDRRARCCTPNHEPLDWDQILRENTTVAKKLEVAR